MPRYVNRDFSAMARAQNEALWSRQAGQVSYGREALDAILARATDQFEAAAHVSQAAYLSDRRKRLAGEINDTIEEPKLFWDHAYFRHLPGSVLETGEAVAKLRQVLAREISKCHAGHWSANPVRVRQLREAMVFARYFRRFSQRVWMRQAEAA